MKGDKVYILIEDYTYDYETEQRVSVFADKQEAYNKLAEIKEMEIQQSWISRYDDEDLEVGSDDYDYFDIYLDGYASQYETSLRVVEKEIK